MCAILFRATNTPGAEIEQGSFGKLEQRVDNTKMLTLANAAFKRPRTNKEPMCRIE